MTQKVLVVDDELVILDILATWLEDAGYETCTAANGLQGLQELNDRSPDLVVADIMMPQMDGYELCRMMRQISTAPIMILTGLGLETHRKKGLALGADLYLTKPVSMTVFLAHVSRLLRRRRRGLPAVIDILNAHRPKSV